MGGFAMSVINQMLNQLEQRGADGTYRQSAVRAVPPAGHHTISYAWASGLLAAIGAAAWLWTSAHDTHAPVANTAATAIEATFPREATSHSSTSTGPDKLTPQQPANVASSAPRSFAPNQPASRLSFELSTAPSHESPHLPGVASVQQDAPSPSKHRRPVVRKKATLQPTQGMISKSPATAGTNEAMSPMKQVSAAQLADAEFRKAAALMQQGRIADAQAGFTAALRQDPDHDAARQALVALLVEEKQGAEAERVLQDRLNSKPDDTGFAMLLARLQVERNAVADATATLEKGLPYANQQADYQAFLAALLQRQNRNSEAIAHYQVALQLAPNNGIWLMGYGISLQAMQRNADARAAFRRALDTHTLSPGLQAFVQQKLRTP